MLKLLNYLLKGLITLLLLFLIKSLLLTIHDYPNLTTLKQLTLIRLTTVNVLNIDHLVNLNYIYFKI